jgi:hypothetical protein
MNTRLDVNSAMSAYVERTRGLETLEESTGKFLLEHWRKNDAGLYLLRDTIPFNNGATNTGKQYVLGSAFAGVTPITVWYLGLIDGTAGTPTIDPADTPASHTGWTEFVSYDETVRQTWTKGLNAPSNQYISTAAAQYTVSSGVAPSAFVAGGFLISNSTKSGTTGTLYAHGLFPTAVPVVATDIFKLNYTTGL